MRFGGLVSSLRKAGNYIVEISDISRNPACYYYPVMVAPDVTREPSR